MHYEVKCPDCCAIVDSKDIQEHVVHCKAYKYKLLPTTFALVKYMPEDELRFLLAEIQLTKDKIQKRIGVSNNISKLEKKLIDEDTFNNNDYIKTKKGQPTIVSKQKESTTIGQSSIKQQRSNKIEQKEVILRQKEVQYVKCQNCEIKMNSDQIAQLVYNYNCLHLFCVNCVKSYFLDLYVEKKGNLKCLMKGCKFQFPSQQIRQVLGKQALEKLQMEIIRSSIQFIKCCKCGHQYEFTQGRIQDAPKTDPEGKKLTKPLAEHYAKNRFICRDCKSEQCKICKSAPYHIGKTCSQNEQFKNSKKCRYCNGILRKGYTSNMGIKAFDDICNKKQCQKVSKNACSKVHPCGHSCLGYKNQSKCLPCLNETCSKKQAIIQHDQDQESFCTICYVECLKSGPLVKSKCGHIFHYQCLQRKLQIRWLTPRIQFSFCRCPICKSWLQLPEDCPLNRQIKTAQQLYDNLKQKAQRRLKFEKLQKDVKITDEKSQFYQKPIDYAMAIYAYFECFKCKKPYFGGRKSCSDMMNDEQNSGRQSFDSSKLVCSECCPIDTKNCSLHGKQFILFKCKFCCNIGQWFCWGSTHFCDDCHKRQQKGQYISKLSRDKLPKCEGKQKCQSGGDHGENGIQYCLGCQICRDDKSEGKGSVQF